MSNSFPYHRHSIRLKDYDYSKEGMYFITICTKNRKKHFGEIINVGAGLASAQFTQHTIQMKLNNIGIIIISDRADARPAPTIGDIMSYLKSKSVCECIKKIGNYTNIQFNQIWQRNYYEHIIRNEKELYKIQQYIKYNPLKWNSDNLHVI